jgi:diguanylate cyclase (GGDEF)-like protein
MCLNTIAREASVIVIAATAFLVIAFVARGSGLTLGLAPLVAIAAYFIIRMLDEHFRMFAEIVRSRFVIAEMQRVAEEAREAAMTIALTDDLTGLPNRRCFQSLLADRITAATETGEPFALGLIDLDGFKPINDLHGHPVGDDILRQVAERLAKAMNGRGSAARIGGDEFAILCNGVGARDEAVALGKEIQAIFATPFDVSPLGVRLSCACGFALFPSTAAEPNELVRLADAALYREGQRIRRRGHVRHKSGTHSREQDRLRERPPPRDRWFGARRTGCRLRDPSGGFHQPAGLDGRSARFASSRRAARA